MKVKTIRFSALKCGAAFQFATDLDQGAGPVWVRCRGGFRPGRGGQLHKSICARHMLVIIWGQS